MKICSGSPRLALSHHSRTSRLVLGIAATGVLITLSACGNNGTEPSASRNAAAESAGSSSSPAVSSSSPAPVGAQQIQEDQGAFVTYTNNSGEPMRFWGFVGRFGEDAVTADLMPSESTTFWGWHINPVKAAVSMKGLVCLDEECSDYSRIVIMEYSTRTVQAADRKGTKESANIAVGQSKVFRIGDQSISVVRQPNTANKSSQWEVTFTDPA